MNSSKCKRAEQRDETDLWTKRTADRTDQYKDLLLIPNFVHRMKDSKCKRVSGQIAKQRD